jgi:hypothetical protein
MKILYSGSRYAGKNILAHKWFLEMAKTMKKGQTLGIADASGVYIFQFKGLKKNSESKIEIKGIDEAEVVRVNTQLLSRIDWKNNCNIIDIHH